MFTIISKRSEMNRIVLNVCKHIIFPRLCACLGIDKKMRISKLIHLLHLIILVNCSPTNTEDSLRNFPLSSVEDFFRGIWDKMRGKPHGTDADGFSLKSKGSIVYALTLVSNTQWTDIMKSRGKILSDAEETLALSQLISKVRDDLGQKVANLTDIELSDIMYSMELKAKYTQQEGVKSASKFFSLGVPYMRALFRDVWWLWDKFKNTGLNQMAVSPQYVIPVEWP